MHQFTEGSILSLRTQWARRAARGAIGALQSAERLVEHLRSEGGRKSLGLAIALLLELLLLLLLLSLNYVTTPPVAQKPLVTEFESANTEDEAKTPEPEPEKASAAPPVTSQPVDTPDVPLPPSPLTPPPAAVIPTTNTLPPPPVSPPAPQPSATTPPRPGVRLREEAAGPAAPGASSSDSQRVGTAPNGEPMYAARWYREPTNAELAGYLSTASGPGWGLITCRTVPDYRVEDCVPLAEYPEGSNMNRAVLAAAWQFRVRPPRIGGRDQVGAWVRIRIDYTIRPAPGGPGPVPQR